MIFNKNIFLNAVKAVENIEIFEITKKFKNLSQDVSSSSQDVSSSSQDVSSSNFSLGSTYNTVQYSSTSTLIERFRASINHSQFTREVMDFTKMPFLDIPKTVIDLTSNSTNYMLSLGFRFMPGQADFLIKNLRLPETLDRLKGLRDSLGLKLAKDSLTNRGILKFQGFSEIHAKSSMLMDRVLLEAITYNSGFYGRFLVLVQIGVGCTVWYGFAPGDGIHIPFDLTNLFSPIKSYEQFYYNPDSYVHPGFEKMTLLENEKNTISTLTTAYTEEKPFVDIKIPNNNNTHAILGITVGLVIVVLLSVGLSPIAESST